MLGRQLRHASRCPGLSSRHLSPPVACAHTLLKLGEVVEFKRCRFQAAVYRIDGTDDVAAAVLDHTAAKKVAKASHPAMLAWRAGNGSAAGVSDDGERGSGGRLLGLLEQRNCDGVLVCVTRWYGGSHLGSARFRAIVGAAADVLQAIDDLDLDADGARVGNGRDRDEGKGKSTGKNRNYAEPSADTVSEDEDFCCAKTDKAVYESSPDKNSKGTACDSPSEHT